MNLATLLIELLFAILFVATLVSYLRRRDALSRDVMLIFASLAGLFLVAGVGAVIGQLPDVAIGVAFALLLAQPVFTLRLADRLHPISRPVRLGATALWAACALPIMVLPLRQVPLILLAGIVVFVVTDVTAAAYLLQEARRRYGSARRRIQTAAAGTLLMAVALGMSTVVSSIPILGDVGSEVGRIVGLLAAVLFLFAFLPPRWSRRLGSAVTTFEFTEKLLDGAFGEGADAIWARLADLGRRTTGAAAALVVVGEPPELAAWAAADDFASPGALSAARLRAVPGAADGDRPLSEDDGDLADLARAVGAPYVSVLPFELAGGEPGALVLLRERPSLFAADDHEILTALIDRARVFAERSEAMKEAAALAQRLSATVQALEQAGQAKATSSPA